MGLIMDKFYNPFLNILPEIDIHGLSRDMVKCIVDEFINDNIKLKNDKIVVIHGKGKGVLMRELHLLLKSDIRVNKYYLDGFNNGCTVIELN